MRRKLWPKAPAKEGVLGHMLRNFQVYFMHINFFNNPKKKNYNRAKKLYCNATIFVFWFFIVYLAKKKWNWKMAQGCRLSPTHKRIFFTSFEFPDIQNMDIHQEKIFFSCD